MVTVSYTIPLKTGKKVTHAQGLGSNKSIEWVELFILTIKKIIMSVSQQTVLYPNLVQISFKCHRPVGKTDPLVAV